MSLAAHEGGSVGVKPAVDVFDGISVHKFVVDDFNLLGARVAAHCNAHCGVFVGDVFGGYIGIAITTFAYENTRIR